MKKKPNFRDKKTGSTKLQPSFKDHLFLKTSSGLLREVILMHIHMHTHTHITPRCVHSNRHRLQVLNAITNPDCRDHFIKVHYDNGMEKHIGLTAAMYNQI